MNRIFEQHMSELYWLAYLLTGDRERSVQAFTGALNSDAESPALQRFMLSWARRLVIVEALATIRRQIRESALRTRPATRFELKGRLTPVDRTTFTKQELEEALLSMDVLQRCVVILTIFEGLKVKDAAGLLGVDVETVKAAQARGVTAMTLRMAVIGPVSPRPFSLSHSVMVAFG